MEQTKKNKENNIATFGCLGATFAVLAAILTYGYFIHDWLTIPYSGPVAVVLLTKGYIFILAAVCLLLAKWGLAPDIK